MFSLVSIGGWLLGKALNFASSGVVDKAVAVLGGSADGIARLREIEGRTQVALAEQDTKRHEVTTAALNARQAAKMNWPVFWVIIVIMLGAPALIIWSVTLYNIFWWEHGIWPQPWAIADYPASIKPWVQMSIDWLYDPLGAPTGIGSAFVAGRLAGR